MAREKLSTLIDRASPGGTLILPAGEFEGPVVIGKPLTIEGRDTMVWARKGPVLTIESSGVVLQDLNVEITGREKDLTGQEACAIVVHGKHGVTLNDVSVRGNVLGLDEEEGDWRYPRSLNMMMAAKERHEFQAIFLVPVPCRLVSNVAGLTLKPASLKAGQETEVTVRVDPLPAGMRIRGGIALRTAFLSRKVTIIGNVGGKDREPKCKIQYWSTLGAATPTPAPPDKTESLTTEKAKPSRPKRKQPPMEEKEPTTVAATEARPIPDRVEPDPLPPKEPKKPDIFDTPKPVTEPSLPGRPAPRSTPSIPQGGLWTKQGAEGPEAEKVGPVSAPQGASRPPEPADDQVDQAGAGSSQSVAPTDGPMSTRIRPPSKRTTRRVSADSFAAFGSRTEQAAEEDASETPPTAPDSEERVREESTDQPDEDEQVAAPPATQKPGKRRMVRHKKSDGFFGQGGRAVERED